MKKSKWCVAAVALLAAAAFMRAPGQVRFDVVKTEDVRVVREGKAVVMTEEEYLTGVLACEMPAAYEAQALMAQAVCARTRLAWQREQGGCGAGDICARSEHCQGYLDEAERREKWGAHFARYEAKLLSAVRATQGEVLTYAGKPIVMLYHARSGGATEDVEHVFAQALPYLRGVESPEEEEAYTVMISMDMAVERLDGAFPQAHISREAPLEEQLRILTRYESGRVESVRVGDIQASGSEIRRALGLRSAQFDFAFGRDALEVTQWGYGHGVGMSQAGAQTMALSGKSYREILLHYYPGAGLHTEDNKF